jgi:hypothetical protein
MEDNSTGKRRQTLPTVKTIKVDSIKPNKYKIDVENQTYDGYVVNLSWTYDNPKLGYDDEGEIYIINVDNKLYVVEKK